MGVPQFLAIGTCVSKFDRIVQQARQKGSLQSSDTCASWMSLALLILIIGLLLHLLLVSLIRIDQKSSLKAYFKNRRTGPKSTIDTVFPAASIFVLGCLWLPLKSTSCKEISACGSSWIIIIIIILSSTSVCVAP
ncbi:hypothetical protein WN944_002202 [Citrus x changshan-huyou]|uniref:Uncharacterized protein n=1 Tax=Citrus x changshan-huyou TaxID=2935761 RepID=A0AAP0MG54_9ROSI